MVRCLSSALARRGGSVPRRVVLLVAALTVAAAPAAVVGQRPSSAPASPAPRPDTLPLPIAWTAPDSVMQALLEREGYRATRYQADEIVVEAGERIVRLRGTPAVLRRGTTTIVADTIRYDATSGEARALGERIIVRDPARAQGDLVARRELVYDVHEHEARLVSATFAVDGSTTWFVHAGRAVLANLGPGGRPPTLYATDGWLTSCENESPHYHVTVRSVKVVAGRLIVARSALVHVGGVPVFWLPFLVQDLRPGGGTGFLMPRIGFSDAFSGRTTRQPHIENVGVRLTIGPAFDGRVSLDWRRGSERDTVGAGWVRYNASAAYASPSDRLAGQLAVSHLRAGATTNTSLAWSHEQRFSARHHRLVALANLASDPALRRAASFHPYQTLAVLRSAASYTRHYGGTAIALGANRRTYPDGGRSIAEFPVVSITAAPIALGSRAAWTPSFGMVSSRVTGDAAVASALGPIGAPGPMLRTSPGAERVRSTITTLDAPLALLGVTWRNAATVAHHDVRLEQEGVVPSDARSRFTTVDWRTELLLPTLSPRRWNLTPAIALANVDPAPWLVRTSRSGTGRFLRQPKRLQIGVTAAPTFHALLPGVGRFARLRHSVTPIVRYAFAPRARVDDAYLAAIGRSREDYVGDLTRSRLSVALAMSIEGTVGESPGALPAAERRDAVKLLSVTIDALAYDFERARHTGHTGIASESVGMVLRSDLLAGLDLGARLTVLGGSPLSDTARVRLRLRRLHLGFSLGGITDPFGSLERAFGRAVPLADADSATSPLAPWHAALAFTAVRPHPLGLVGSRFVIDPELPTFPGSADRLTALQLRAGGRRGPWAADALAMYDMAVNRVSAHMVRVERELHDWRVGIGHVRASNGNSSFTVSLRLRQKPRLAPPAVGEVIRTIDVRR